MSLVKLKLGGAVKSTSATVAQYRPTLADAKKLLAQLR